jgi:hypothetical protein
MRSLSAEVVNGGGLAGLIKEKAKSGRQSFLDGQDIKVGVQHNGRDMFTMSDPKGSSMNKSFCVSCTLL